MKWHSHVIIEPPRGKMIWYPRWFFHLYRGPEYGERTLLDGHLEFVLSKPTAEFAVSLEVGTAGSETPFDGHLTIAGSTLYWGIKQGSRLADRITQRWFSRLQPKMHTRCLDRRCDCPTGKYGPGDRVQRHVIESPSRYEGRRIWIRIDDWRLWLELWTLKNHWTKGQFAPWRSRSIRLNPLDRWLGEQRYWYNEVETRTITIQLPEGFYTVQARLEEVHRGRPKGRRVRQPWAVDVDVPNGIPNRYDSSGGCKGDRVYGFGVQLKQGRRADWWIDAKAAIEARILQNRADSGFRRPQLLEPKGNELAEIADHGLAQGKASEG